MSPRRILIILLLILMPRLSFAFDPPTYFEKNCSSCHSIGQGDGVGPDLKGINDRRKREWLISFIQSSQTVIQSGDPIAVELFNKFKQIKMPDQDLKPDEINALLDFIVSGGPAEVATDSKPASAATAADITRGRDLFLGKIPLAKGGPSCVSCHRVANFGPLGGGGTLGLNLTQVFSKYEDKGLSKSLKMPGFRIMKEVYAEKPLTDDETFALKAFLYQADQGGLEGSDPQNKFLFLGLGGMVLMLGATDWIWRKRRQKSMKPWSRKSGW